MKASLLKSTKDLFHNQLKNKTNKNSNIEQKIKKKPKNKML